MTHTSCIHYSVGGQDCAHASRARHIIDHVRRFGRVQVHAGGQARDFLAVHYAGDAGIEVLRRPAPTDLRGLLEFERRVARCKQTLTSVPTLLVLAEQDAALELATRWAGVPLVTIDHASSEPPSGASEPTLRARARDALARIERWRAPLADHQIVARLDPRGAVGKVDRRSQVGVLLRAAVLAAEPGRGGYLVAHLSSRLPLAALEALRRAPMEVRLYGAQAGSRVGLREGSLVRRAASESGFIADLARCEALISDPSVQRMAEALHLDKPILALTGRHGARATIAAEQVRRTGAGDRCELRAFDRRVLQEFLERRADFARIARGFQVDGTGPMLRAIDGWLPLADRGVVTDRAPQRAERDDVVWRIAALAAS